MWHLQEFITSEWSSEGSMKRERPRDDATRKADRNAGKDEEPRWKVAVENFYIYTTEKIENLLTYARRTNTHTYNFTNLLNTHK